MKAVNSIELGFTHRFVPATGTNDAPTLLLLHGTGGNEEDLLGIGRLLLEQANLLSPRGKVLEHGNPRFFRRVAEGVFDQADLRIRTDELATFLQVAARAYDFDAQRVIAVGYSNGANIAGSLLLRQPEVLAGAVLFHPMTPFIPETLPGLHGKPVYIAAGRRDPIVPVTETERLAALLRASGVDLVLNWHDGGHSLNQEEVAGAQHWLAQEFRPQS